MGLIQGRHGEVLDSHELVRPRLERLAMALFHRHVKRMKAEQRRERLARLADKWGARLVVSGRVVREGGAR